MTGKKIIDTGLVEFILPFDRGEEKIYFNPNDVEFFIRLTDMINNISGMYDGLADEYEKTEDSFEKLEIIRKLNSKIKDAFDVAFGNNVADTIQVCFSARHSCQKSILFFLYTRLFNAFN